MPDLIMKTTPLYPALSPGAVSLAPESFATAAALAAAGGFAGLELPVATLGSPEAVASVRHSLETHGLKAAGWGLPLEWRADDATWLEGLGRLPAYARAAAEFDCRRCFTWVLSFSDERSWEENFAFHLDRLQPVAAILAEHGCRLGLEYLGPKTLWDAHRHPFIHTMDEMLGLCRQVGPDTGLLLDSWHWFTAGESIDSIGRLDASDIVYVHVNDAPAGVTLDEQVDNRRCLPCATGMIPIGDFLRAVADTGYKGPVVPEPFDATLTNLADDQARVAKVGASMRQAWVAAGFG